MPKKVDHTKRRESIAKAAFAVIARDGIGAVTLRSVAEQAHTSPQLLTHYIKSREGLLLAAYNHFIAMTLERMIAAEQRYKGVEALRRSLWEGVPMDKKSEDNFRVWLSYSETASQSAPIRMLLNQGYQESNAHFARIIRHAQALGEVPKNIDIEMTAWGATMLVVGLGTHIVGGGEKISVAEKKHFIDHWIERMLSPKKARQS